MLNASISHVALAPIIESQSHSRCVTVTSLVEAPDPGMERPGKRTKGEEELDDADSFVDGALGLEATNPVLPPAAEMHSGVIALGQLALQTAALVEKIGYVGNVFFLLPPWYIS